MFIEKITICNMFAYYGKVEVEFKKQEGRNLYCIYGDNGFGKTSFIRCVKILFLGVHNGTKLLPAIRKIAPKIQYSSYTPASFIKGYGSDWLGILNKDAYDENQEDFYIEFEGILDEENFCIRRSFKNVTKMTKIDEILEFQLGKDFFKNEKAQEMLDKIIPPNLNEFFFFDGEQIENISNNLRTEFREKIEEILGIKCLELAIRLIQGYERELKWKESQNEKEEIELKQLRNDVETIEENIDFCTKQIKKQGEEIEKQIEIIEQLQEKIFKLGADSSEEKSNLIREKNELDKNLNTYKNSFKESIKAVIFINNAPLIQELKNELSQLETNQSKNDIQSYKRLLPNLKESIRQELKSLNLAEHILIFENILENLPKKLEAKNFKDSFINSAISGLLRENLARYERMTLASDIRQIKDTLDRLKRNEKERDNLNNDEYTQNRIKELDGEKKIADDLKFEAQTAKKNLQEKLDDLRDEKEEKEKKIYRLEQNINTERIDDKLDILESLQDSLNQYQKRLIKSLRVELKTLILENYQKLINDNVRGLEIDDDFSITLKNINDEAVVIENQSSGQKQILAIAIFWALSKLAESNLPLIIDTPLARIDSENRANIIRNYYANASRQVVILPTDTEISSREYEYAQKYIAGLYKIDNQSNRRHATIKTANIDEILKEGTNGRFLHK